MIYQSIMSRYYSLFSFALLICISLLFPRCSYLFHLLLNMYVMVVTLPLSHFYYFLVGAIKAPRDMVLAYTLSLTLQGDVVSIMPGRLCFHSSRKGLGFYFKSLVIWAPLDRFEYQLSPWQVRHSGIAVICVPLLGFHTESRYSWSSHYNNQDACACYTPAQCDVCQVLKLSGKLFFLLW